MLSNNRLPDAMTLVKAQPDLTAPSDTAAIAASGARFREAMQAQQRAADADTTSARQIRAHDAAEARNDAQRTVQARQTDRIQQQSVRDQAMHASDMRALATRAASERAAASEATKNADTAQQQRLSDANNADTTVERAAAKQTQSRMQAAQDAKSSAMDAAQGADGANAADKRLRNAAGTSAATDSTSTQAAVGVPGQPNTDAAVQAIAGRGQQDGRQSDTGSESAADGGNGDGQNTASVGNVDSTQTGTMAAAQPAAQGGASNGAAGTRSDAGSNASDAANGIASTDGRSIGTGSGALNGGFAASNTGNGVGANGSFQANGAAGNALNTLSGAARGVQGSAQNTAGTGESAQTGGAGTPNAAAAFGAKLAAQRAQDDNAASATDAFNAAKKSDDTGNGTAMSDASADLSASADQSKSTDSADTTANAGTNNPAIDPNLLAGSATHTADNSLMATAQAQSNQAPAASQNAYASGNIDMPFADARWADAFSQRVVMMPRGGQTQASLHLNPPNLGPVQVTVSMVGNQAQASFVSQHAHVRDAIAAALPSLKDRFAESGMALTQTNVTDTMPTNATNATNAANPNFNASLAAGLNTSADASAGGRGQQSNAAPDPFATSGVRRTAASSVASGAAANAWRPAGAPIDNGNARLGIDTFA